MLDSTCFLDALKNGDGEAWEQFYHSYLLPLRPMLTRRFNGLSPEEVDDVWADAIEKVCRRIETVRVPRALGSWLWTVAHNTGLSYVIGQKRRQEVPIVEETLLDEQGDPLQDLARNDALVAARLRAAFEALPATHRSVLMLRVRDGMPAEVVHHFTQLTPNQQRGVLGNIRLRFRKADLRPFQAAAS